MSRGWIDPYNNADYAAALSDSHVLFRVLLDDFVEYAVKPVIRGIISRIPKSKDGTVLVLSYVATLLHHHKVPKAHAWHKATVTEA